MPGAPRAPSLASEPGRGWLRLATVGFAVALALVLRFDAADRLVIDFDEDDYLLAASRYASALQSRDWGGLVNEDLNFEHPPLAKLCYAVPLGWLPPIEPMTPLPPYAAAAASLPEPHFHVARWTAAVLGSMHVLAVSLLSPLAGLLLAVHTWHIKYTSQVMLEPLPSLTASLVLFFYVRASHARRPRLALVLSAAALGLTAASKYLYSIVGVAVLADWSLGIARRRPTAPRALAAPVGWGALALLTFLLTNPYLWPAPITRLGRSLGYHRGFHDNRVVHGFGYPVWQPLAWLVTPVPWQPEVFPVRIDALTAGFAVVGLVPLWRRWRAAALWLSMGLPCLLMLPARWPHYILIILTPLALAAGLGLERVGGALLARWRRPLATP